MLELFRFRKFVIHQWWYVVLLDFEASTEEFYQSIEQDLAARKLQGLDISRITYSEGGLLSAKRVYLRMCRERFLFDVCSAPFGTSWFYSCRVAEKPIGISLLDLIIALSLGVIFWFSYMNLFGFFVGNIMFGATIVGLLLMLLCVEPFGFDDLDAALLQIPVIGSFYEVLFRKETYYRQDTRAAYMNIVNHIVRARIIEIAEAHGVDKIEFIEAVPMEGMRENAAISWFKRVHNAN